MTNKTSIAYRIRTTATDGDGNRIVFESFDKEAATRRLAELRLRDPKARILGIPVAGR